MTQDRTLTLRDVFWFWLPLAVMWLIMSTEQPSITAIVSRLPNAKENLAAFGLTFSFALIVESPVIMLLTAATALATDARSYRRLLQFTGALVATETALHLCLALTPLYGYIVRNWIGAPEQIIETSRVAFLLMTPWTGTIAFRRLFEGVMIRWGQPQRVTLVIVARIAATVLVLLAGLALGRWPGAYVGGTALSAGVTTGALAAFWLSRSTVATHLRQQDASGAHADPHPLTWRRLSAFYIPLALTSLITMVGGPIISYGLSRAPQPLESLAVWPVVMSVLFIGRSFGIAYQEVGVALLQRPSSHDVLRRYALTLAGATTLGFALFAVSPASAVWYARVAGLAPDLVSGAVGPTLIAGLVPALTTLISWLRALLIHEKRTAPISAAVALNMLALAAVVAVLPRVAAVSGAVLAALALSASLLVEWGYLAWRTRAGVRSAPLAVSAPAR